MPLAGTEVKKSI